MKKPAMLIQRATVEGVETGEALILTYWEPDWRMCQRNFAGRPELDAFLFKKYGPIQGGPMRRCEET